MGISVYPPASGGITTRTLKQAVFNSSGTWTYPTSSKFDGTVEVTCVAGGGGAGAALNRSGSTYYYSGGGGGGGQVILRRQLSVLGAGNQTVTIGAGGASNSQTGGLFGHPSTFGSGYIRNLYPDPALTKGLYLLRGNVGALNLPETYSVSNSYEMSQVFTWSSGTNPPQPPAGNTYIDINLGNGQPAYTQYVSVKASTSYRIIYSHSASTSPIGGATVTPTVFWFNSSGAYISENNITTFTSQSTSGTWTAVSSTVSSPAGAVYARICWVTTAAGGVSFTLNGIQFAETAANVTTVAYGGASGYAWSGVPDNSYTINESETLIVAQGGGGGWGACQRISNNGQVQVLPGHAGYTSGGMGMAVSSNPGTGDIYISGGGGGAGGNAQGPEFPTQLGSGETYKITDGSARYGYTDSASQEYVNWHAAINTAAAFVGSESARYNITTNQIPFSNFGTNGPGVEGYGYGGQGSAKSGVGNYMQYLKTAGSANPYSYIGFTNNYSPSSAASQSAFRGRPNSGNGGHGWWSSTGNSTAFHGQPGGSGVVIVRWYE